MRDHFHHETNQVRLLVHWSGKCTRENLDDVDVYSFLLFMDETLERYEEPDHLQLPGLIEAIVGPCNGVFCVTNTYNKLALWNPSTRKMRPLPSPKRFNINEEIGLGVDPLTNEFKILLIHPAPHFSIYTSNSDSWRYFENEALLKDSFLSIIECGTAFFKGVYYWRKYNRKTSTTVILAFDMRYEVFQEIEMPNGVGNEFFQETMLNDDGSIKLFKEMPGVNVARRRAVLDLFEDSLAIFCYDHDINVCTGNHVDVWVMKEHGSWIRTFSLQVPFYFHCPLGFWMGKHILFSKWDESVVNEELVMYMVLILVTERLFRVPFREDAHGRKLWVFNYKKSLFLLREKQDSRLRDSI